jgi:hypothetical protein
MEVTAETLAQRILPLLPQDGTPVLNRVMRVMLSRQLEIQIEPELYFAARDLLLQTGKIGRSCGQSGQIFLAALNGSQPATAEPALPAEPWPEARLMQPLRTYLERAFRRGLDLPADGISLVQDSSTIGRLTKSKTLSLAKQLDKDNPDLKTASPEWCRQRIADLASGGAEPVFKNILEYSSMKVTRTRTPKAK